LKNHPGTNPTPTPKALVNLLNEISEEMEVSNIQMMKGIKTNIRTPLMRCRIDTHPAGGRRYVGRSFSALILRNSGREGRLEETSSVMGGLSVGNGFVIIDAKSGNSIAPHQSDNGLAGRIRRQFSSFR
jgi:hypothetical protein